MIRMQWMSAALALGACMATAGAQEPFKQYVDPAFYESRGDWYSHWYPAIKGRAPYAGEPQSMVLGSKSAKREITYKLDQAVPPGTYRVFLLYYHPADGTGDYAPIYVKLNGAEVSRPYPERTEATGIVRQYGYREFPPITTTRGGDELSIRVGEVKKLDKDGIYSSQAGNFSICGIYVTGDPRDRLQPSVGRGYNFIRIYGTRSAAATETPTATSRAAAEKNLLANGSFEVGCGGGWKFAGSNAGIAFNHLCWKPDGGAEGSAFATVPQGVYPYSDAYELPAGSYTLSAYVRGGGKLRLALNDAKTMALYDINPAQSKAFDLADQWQRVSFSVKVPQGRYFVVARSGKAFDLDGVQLQRGELTDYAPPAVEVGAMLPRVGHSYSVGERVAGDLRVRSADKAAPSRKVWYRVVNYFGKTVKQGETNVPLTQGVGKAPLDVTPDEMGIFRMELGAAGRAEPLEEVAFTVHPDADADKARAPSFIGVYGTLSDQVCPVMARAGLHWTMAFSGCKLASWPETEPKKGQFVWMDKEVTAAREAGLEISACIDYRRGGPKWLKQLPKSDTINSRPENMQDWTDFIYALVDHYKADIKSWIVLDDIDHFFTVDDYLIVSKAASEAARKADPACKLIMWDYARDRHTAAQNKKVRDEINQYCDGFHQGAAEVSRMYNKPMWRYGFAGSASIYRNHTTVGEIMSANADDQYRVRTPGKIKHDLGLIQEGQAHRFLIYSGRLPPDSKCIFEYDGSLNADGVAVAAMNHFVRGSTYSGEAQTAGQIVGHVFKAVDRQVLVLWSRLGDPLRLKLNMPAGAVEVFDFMGNRQAMPDGAILLDDTPSYVTVQASAAEAFLKQLAATPAESLSVVRAALTTGKNPNELAIAVAVKNTTNAPITTKLEFEPGSAQPLSKQLADPQPLTLAPGDRKSFVFPLRYQPGRPLCRQATIRLFYNGERLDQDARADVLYSRKFETDNSLSADLKKYRIPTVMKDYFGDLKLSADLRDPLGSDKVTTSLYSRYDSRNLYLHVTLTSPEKVLWARNKAYVRFALAPGLTVDTLGTTQPPPVNFDVNLLKDGPGETPLRNADGKASWILVRKDNTLNVEIAVPLAALKVKPDPKSLTLVRANYLLVESDTTGTPTMSWRPWGSATSFEPAEMAHLLLGP